jgi:hypothetical protein
MDSILQKYAGQITAKTIIKTVEELRVEYIDDGITKEDIPPIVARLVFEVAKFKKLTGQKKKKLVIAILNHLIEQIDVGEQDSDFEIILKSLVPSIIESFVSMIKAKKAVIKCIPCIA